MGQSLPARSAIALIVEDEPLMRMLAADLVKEMGFVPIEAGDADQALTVLDALNEVEVMFTDVNMPGMTGIELAERVRQHWPHVKIIVTSGRHWSEMSRLPNELAFVRKPYTHETLSNALGNTPPH